MNSGISWLNMESKDNAKTGSNYNQTLLKLIGLKSINTSWTISIPANLFGAV